MSKETRFTCKALRACEVDILQPYAAKSANGKGGVKKPDVRHPVFLCVRKSISASALFVTGRKVRQQVLHERADVLRADRIHAVHRIPETGREGDFPVFQLRAQHF